MKTPVFHSSRDGLRFQGNVYGTPEHVVSVLRRRHPDAADIYARPNGDVVVVVGGAACLCPPLEAIRPGDFWLCPACGAQDG